MRYRYYHKDTGQMIELVRKLDDRDIGPTLEELHEEEILGYKPEDFERRPEAPLIYRSVMKARRKGYRKATAGEAQESKEVRKLEMDALDLPDIERGPIETEIAKLAGFDDD